MQQFDIPKKSRRELINFISNVYYGDEPGQPPYEQKLEGGRQPVSFADHMLKLKDYKDFIPRETPLSPEFIKKMDAIAERVSENFAHTGSEKFNSAMDGLISSLQSPSQFDILRESIDRFKAAAQDIDTFIDMFKALKEDTTAMLRARQDERNNKPKKAKRNMDELHAGRMEIINEEAIKWNKENPDNPVNPAQERARSKRIDLEDVISGISAMRNDFEALEKQTENARALLAGIAQRSEAVYKTAVRKSKEGPYEGRE